MPIDVNYRPLPRGAKPPAPGSDKRSRLQILEEGIFELQSALARIVGNVAAHSGNTANSEIRNLDRVKRMLALHLRGEKLSTATQN